MDVIIPPDMQFTLYRGERATLQPESKLVEDLTKKGFPISELKPPEPLPPLPGPPPPPPAPPEPGGPVTPWPEDTVRLYPEWNAALLRDLRLAQLEDAPPMRFSFGEYKPPSEPDWGTIALPPPKETREAYLARLDKFQKKPEVMVGLNLDTGLPGYMVGSLADPIDDAQDNEPYAPAVDFLDQHDLLLSGTAGATRVVLEQQNFWRSNTYQAHFRQVNGQGVPLYGAAIAFTSQGRQLVFVSNSLYPALPEEIDGYSWDTAGDSVFRQNARRVDQLGITGLPRYIKPVFYESPADLRDESHKNGWLADRWILPVFDSSQDREHDEEDSPQWWNPAARRAGGPGTYRPAWRVIAVDKQDQRWLLMIDAETHQVLLSQSTAVHAPVIAPVYLTPGDARNIAPTQTKLDLEEGHILAGAQPIGIQGDRSREIALPAGPDPTNEEVHLRLLTATVYHHVRFMQCWFEDLVQNSQELTVMIATSGVARRSNPSERQDICLPENSSVIKYERQTHSILLGTATVRINEPGFDADVICHEFVHAITHYLNPILFENPSAGQANLIGGLNEGLAFFLPCSINDRPRWAEFAYDPTTWQKAFDFGSGDLVLQHVPRMSDLRHRYGIWWARMFWALRAILHQQTHILLLVAIAGLAPATLNLSGWLNALVNRLDLDEPDATEVQTLVASSGLNA